MIAESSSSNQASTEAQQMLDTFWQRVTEDIKNLNNTDFKNQELPLARIKKIMKLDDDVKVMMISAEAPVLFAKAAEIFITELSLRAWIHTEENKRRTLQRNDIAMAITKYDQFDFLIDIVPREELKPNTKRQPTAAVATGPTSLTNLTNPLTGVAVNTDGTTAVNPEQVQYYFQLAQQQAALQQTALQQSALQQTALQQTALHQTALQQTALQQTTATNPTGQPIIVQGAGQAAGQAFAINAPQLVQLQLPAYMLFNNQ
ncbi:nuclear transcription factor Y subunit gamma [Tetranychus urticae]|uniref:Nuclear transcription factor Y subunit gamma n=1 Tax=Tetranychus urticae TaxID=32264 RepID=T1KN34_TETUR|nr:nuclear transcription factor Y subunit gamma [Tetranychus urticae]